MSEITLVQAKLRTIEALVKSEGPKGKLEIAHSTDIPLGDIKKALDELVPTGLVREEGDKYTMEVEDSDMEFSVVTEVVLDILDLLGPLPPRDLADCVIDILGEEYGPGKIQGIASSVARSKKTQLRRRSVGGGGATKWSRDFYYLLKQTDELGMRLRLYESSKLREQWRQRIREAATTAETSEEEWGDYLPAGEGEEEPFDTFDEFIDHLRSMDLYQDQIVHMREIEKQKARHGKISKEVDLHERIEIALKDSGIWPLYTHQVETLNAIARGEHVVVATPNASGKTLCYSLPIFDAVLKEPGTKALYITPTKALEQDQLLRFRKFYIKLEEAPSAETYDGDTPKKKRKEIKSHLPDIILTNPDELHYGILPFHQGWEDFFRKLRVVAIDEMHIYQGVFGSNVSNILRRLRRICRHYGSDPIFICASATIANPKEFAERLVGLPFTVIDNNGAPQGPKKFVFWNPPMEEDGTRRSPYTEAVHLFKEHVKHGIRNITFAKARRIAELVLRWSKNDFDADLGEKIRSYRAGYTPAERRSIEKGLSTGGLLGVTATNALELGIDIGDLDATILIGYPGTIASTWQQANRAGRGEEEALITMIALHDPLDQFFMHHPDHFFGRPMENAVIDPQNEYLLHDHLTPAAFELPLDEEGAREFMGEKALEILPELEKEDLVERKDGNWVSLKKRPHRYVSIRSASRDNFEIIDVSKTRDRTIGVADRARAFSENHKGAIYIHQGETYFVRDLDLKNRKVYVEPIEADYYTEPLRTTTIRVLEEGLSKDLGRSGAASAHYGRIEVKQEMKGFVQVRESSEDGGGDVLSKENLNLPPTVLQTVGFWLSVDEALGVEVENAGLSFEGGLHGIEHVATALLPLYAICDRRDLGGESHLTHSQTGSAGIFLYDNSPGGVGLTEKGYERLEDLLNSVLEAIRDCPCEKGCPSCIHSPYCGRRNEGLDKAASIEILERVLDSEG